MHLLRKIGLWFSANILRLSLIAAATLLPLVLVFGNPESVKDLLNGAGFYDISISQVAKDAVNQENSAIQSREESNEIDLRNPLVGDAIDTALPKETLRSSAETAIDGTYSWLKGSSNYPDFRLDFNEEREVFIESLADNALERAEQLKPCTPSQLLSLNEINPLTIECRPPVDLKARRDIFEAELRANNDLLSDTTFNGEEVLREFERRDSVSIADDIPRGFQLATQAPYIILIVGFLSGVGVVFLADRKLHGLGKVASSLIGSGVFLVITGAILMYISAQIATPSDMGDNQFQEALMQLIQDLRWQLARPLFIIAGAYVISGIVVHLFVRKRKKRERIGASQQVPGPETPETATSPTENKPKETIHGQENNTQDGPPASS